MIFYFSGTGNSKWAAKYVAEATADRLLYIPDEMRGDMTYTLQAGERLGFVIPVHGWRPPVLVRNFLSKCQFVATGPVYTYLVYTAGDSIGKATEMFEADVAPHGLTLSAALSLIMPESYVGLPFMDVDKPEKERAKKQRATTELKQFVTDTILAGATGVRQLVRGPLPALFSGVIGGFFTRYLITDKRFHVDSDRCTHCGLCASVCPVHDISGGKGTEPVWKHQGTCLTCFACYHHCPVHAIEFGRQTQHKGQYYYNKK